jgi:hypothetical protein
MPFPVSEGGFTIFSISTRVEVNSAYFIHTGTAFGSLKIAETGE